MIRLALALGILIASPLLGFLGDTADQPLPWLDAISRLGVVAFLVLALYGLQKKWWVPGWIYRELLERHTALRKQRDDALAIALNSSRGVKQTATVLEEAMVRGLAGKGDQG